ncbi:MAG TPA: methyltransferase [Bryobacteraceae bacterium]|nr:methyltransferase [Bryobacteraceae bacterium]
MQPFRLHVFVCDQQKPEGLPCCGARGGGDIAGALRREISKAGLADEIQVTTCGSLGLCERGPNMVVYPEGVWYSGVRAADAAEIVESHFRNGKPVERLVNTDPAAVKREIEGNRDRYLAAMRARDAAGMLPDELVAMIGAFRESRAILTAIELDLFDAVGQGGNAAAIAARLQTDLRATEMLVNALTAMGMLVKQDGTFRNSPIAERYFTAGSRDNARMAMMHQVRLWKTWSNLTESVRTGRPAPPEPVPSTEAFIAAMHHNAAAGAAPVVGAVGTAGVRRMLDVGGGSGAYSIAFAKANAELRAEILDRAPVVEIAQRHIAAAGLADRVTTRVGDLRTDSFGAGYDLVLISAICHMLSPEENRDLLRRAHEALAPGGRVAVQDFILNPEKTAPRFGALFSLNMLVNTDSGASYSEPEYKIWLRETGFGEIRLVPLPGPSDVILGTRS